MGTIHETGHARNVDNFEYLKSLCLGIGTAFNPSKASIRTEATTELLIRARDANHNVAEKLNRYTEVVDAREIAFLDLDQFATRLLMALQSSNVTEQKLEDARSIIRKIKGQRAAAIELPTSSDNELLPDNETLPTKKSVSQLSYTNRLANFGKLANLYVNEPGYAPNEEELKPAALLAKEADMQAKNTAVIDAATALKNARINRDKILYAKNTGLCDVARDIKAYVGSIFGTSSPEYKAISKIKFTKRA